MQKLQTSLQPKMTGTKAVSPWLRYSESDSFIWQPLTQRWKRRPEGGRRRVRRDGRLKWAGSKRSGAPGTRRRGGAVRSGIRPFLAGFDQQANPGPFLAVDRDV